METEGADLLHVDLDAAAAAADKPSRGRVVTRRDLLGALGG